MSSQTYVTAWRSPKNGLSDNPHFGAPQGLGSDGKLLRKHAENEDVGPDRYAFQPDDALGKAYLDKEPRHRNRSMWAQALVLFNVCGIPLSYGAYLEYYYTTALPAKSVISLSLIIAIQICCIFAMPPPTGFLYQWLGKSAWWRIVFIVAGSSAFIAQLVLQWCKEYIWIVLLQGLVLGSALGTLWTISTLVLASHYRNNLPLVSLQSGFASFAGAVVHTFLAWQSFQSYGGFAQASNGAIVAVTLFIAYFLITRIEVNSKKPWTTQYQLNMRLSKGLLQDLKDEGKFWFVIGYMLIFFSVFIYPIFIVLILSQPPAPLSPNVGAYTLLAMLGTAAFSASVSGNLRFAQRLGPVNTFIAASIFAGAIAIVPTQSHLPQIVITLGAAYGITLGAILSLHMMVSAVLVSSRKRWQDDMPIRVVIMMALGGICAFVGILTSAIVLETQPNGAKIALRVAGACLVICGLFTGFVRFWMWKKFFYAV